MTVRTVEDAFDLAMDLFSREVTGFQGQRAIREARLEYEEYLVNGEPEPKNDASRPLRPLNHAIGLGGAGNGLEALVDMAETTGVGPVEGLTPQQADAVTPVPEEKPQAVKPAKAPRQPRTPRKVDSGS